MRAKSARAGTDAAKASVTAEMAKASGFSRFMVSSYVASPQTFYQQRTADAVPSILPRRIAGRCWPLAIKPLGLTKDRRD
jgi:hypothetical protein